MVSGWRHFGTRFPLPRFGKEWERMHWYAREHHELIKKVFPKANLKTLESVVDPMERAFHKYLHGKGALGTRTLRQAYNGSVQRWLERAKKIIDEGGKVEFKQFKEYIGEVRNRYMNWYKDYQGATQ
jgi:hypothetical protein